MNSLTIIGNLVRDPELRSTSSGVSVCTFVVAVNRRQKREGQPEADFFKVSAWRQLGENCAKWLVKGKKVYVRGPVSVSVYKSNDGEARASMEVTADDVEFLTPAGQIENREPAIQTVETGGSTGGFTAVETDELPF